MKKINITFLFIIIIIIKSIATEVDFFKLEKIAKNPHASLMRSPAIDCLYIYSVDENKHYMGFNIGAKLPFLSVKGDTLFQFEMGGYGAIFSRFELFSKTFDFVHADFLGSTYFDFKYRMVTFETSIYHVSSHLGDDYIVSTGEVVRNTGYEAVREYITISGADYAELTIGFEYKFLKRPGSRIFNNQSVYYGWRFEFIPFNVPIFFEWEAEILDFESIPNIGVRFGFYPDYIFNNLFLGKDHYSKHYHELYFHYYYGYSKMNCFYRKREQLVMAGGSFRL